MRCQSVSNKERTGLWVILIVAKPAQVKNVLLRLLSKRLSRLSVNRWMLFRSAQNAITKYRIRVYYVCMCSGSERAG